MHLALGLIVLEACVCGSAIESWSSHRFLLPKVKDYYYYYYYYYCYYRCGGGGNISSIVT
jgi:hypothetical protein